MDRSRISTARLTTSWWLNLLLSLIEFLWLRNVVIPRSLGKQLLPNCSIQLNLNFKGRKVFTADT